LSEATRFIAHEFMPGEPLLIDREDKRLILYQCNLYGQIYNLKKPICREISNRLVEGLIQRTQNSYSTKTSKASDGYVYEYLMTPEEQARCGSRPFIYGNREMIAQSDSFSGAVRQMCEWVYDRERGTSPEEKANNRESKLRYCADYLSGNPAPPASPPKERGLER
jgi:rubredoxin